MSYEEKISRAREVVASHNLVAKKIIGFDTFLEKLQESGGTTDEALKACTWEDLQSFGLPNLIAKQVASIFRVREEPKRLITEARAQSMSSRDLLAAYDPRNPDTFVGRRLNELSKSKSFLVYNEDGSVNVDTSAKLLDELVDGYPARDSVLVNSRPYKVYQVGQRPNQFAFENPLFPGTLLRPDETCDKTNRTWSNVPEVVRVLIYIAVKHTREIVIGSLDAAYNIMDNVAKSENEIRGRYPRASLLYDEMKARGDLPSLRMSRTKSNDPFYGGHKKY